MKPRSRWMKSMPRSRSRAGACRNVARDTLKAMCSTHLDFSRRLPPGILARLVGEHGEQPAVAGIEVEVVLIGLAQVGLKRMTNGMPSAPCQKSTGALLRGSDDGDVMKALHLYLFHVRLPAG